MTANFLRWALQRIAVVTAICGALPGEAAILVMRVEGVARSQFKPGVKLPENQVIDLGEGASLWLLDNSGTRILRGPGRWQLANSTGGPSSSRLANLVEIVSASARSDRRPVIAATRGKGSTKRAGAQPVVGHRKNFEDMLEIIDVDSNGSYCVWGDKVRFRRRHMDSQPVTIEVSSAKAPVELTFDGVLSNPVSVERLVAGTSEVMMNNGGFPHQARFIRISPPKTLEGLSQSVIEADCRGSLSAIIAKNFPEGTR